MTKAEEDYVRKVFNSRKYTMGWFANNVLHMSIEQVTRLEEMLDECHTAVIVTAGMYSHPCRRNKEKQGLYTQSEGEKLCDELSKISWAVMAFKRRLLGQSPGDITIP